MENPPLTLSDRAPDPEPLVVADPAADPVADSIAEARIASGIWSLEGDQLVSVEQFTQGPAVVLVRSEHVLTMAVALPPLGSVVRRREALPFAIEDRIAEPLEEVHVALGRELVDNTYLAGVVRHDLMRQWVMRLAEAGLERASLVPDALSLPVPGEASWSVDLAGDRALVRAPDGTGFALPLALLEAAWKAAGEPACIAYGDPLPPMMKAAQAGLEAEPLAKRLLAPALDLRQGRYAIPRRAIDPLWKRIALVTAIGALAQGAIAMADTIALNRIAAQREADVRALASTVQPAFVIGDNLETTVTDLTPDADSAQPSQFLSLLSRSGTALAKLQRPVTWRGLAFDRGAGTLTLEVEGQDIAALQSVAQALSAAGLAAQAGAASVDQGKAVGSFAVRGS